MGIVIEIFFHRLAIEHFVKDFFDSQVLLQQVSLKISMAVVHSLGVGKVEVDGFGR